MEAPGEALLRSPTPPLLLLLLFPPRFHLGDASLLLIAVSRQPPPLILGGDKLASQRDSFHSADFIFLQDISLILRLFMMQQYVFFLSFSSHNIINLQTSNTHSNCLLSCLRVCMLLVYKCTFIAPLIRR